MHIRLPKPFLIKSQLLWLTFFLMWFSLLWILSSMPGSGKPSPIPHLDKLAHYLYFCFFGISIIGIHHRSFLIYHPWRCVWHTVLVCAAIGIIDEWHQCYTPLRSGADLLDWLADVFGGLSGAILLKHIYQKFKFHHS